VNKLVFLSVFIAFAIPVAISADEVDNSHLLPANEWDCPVVQEGCAPKEEPQKFQPLKPESPPKDECNKCPPKKPKCDRCPPKKPKCDRCPPKKPKDECDKCPPKKPKCDN
jgi:hypothetical protein